MSGQVNEEPDPVHHRTRNRENHAVGVCAERMPAVDKGRGEESRHHSREHEDSVVESDLLEIHFHFEQKEHLEAPRHARKSENSRADEQQTVERFVERFAEEGAQGLPASRLLLLRFIERRIFALLHHEAHQPEADRIENRRAEEDFARVALRITEDEEVVKRAHGSSDNAECARETSNVTLRNDIVEQIIERRVHKLIEELEEHHQHGNQPDRDRARRNVLQQGDGTAHPCGNVVTATDHDQTDEQERNAGRDERNTPSPAAPAAVAPDADVRRNRHVHQIRNGRENQPDQPVRTVQPFEVKRNDARNHRLHQSEAEVAPQQPDEQRHQRGFRVGERSALEDFRRSGGVCSVHLRPPSFPAGIR